MIQIQKFVARKLGSEFTRNSFILISATTITQIISLLSSVIVLRIYNPVDYGILGLYMTVTGLITVIATLQYHNAIITSEKDQDANRLICIVFTFSLVVALLTLLGVALFKPLFLKLFEADAVGNWLYLAPLSVFFGGMNAGCSAMAVRKKFFKVLSVNRIVTALIVPVVSIAVGVISAGVLGLMLGLLTSQVIPTILLLIYLLRTKSVSWDLQKQSFIALVKRYKNFPIYSFPSDFINNLSNQLPVLMLAKIAGLQAIGYYNLCYRVLGLPSQVISTSIGEVFRQRATEDYHSKGSCRPIFLKVFKTLLLLSIVPFLILILFGPELFSFVFGSAWKEAGSLARIIGLLFVFKFIVSPLTYVINIANKQWVSLIVDILVLGVMALIYAISVYYHLDYKTSLLIYSLAYSTLYFLTFLTCLKFTTYDKHKA